MKNFLFSLLMIGFCLSASAGNLQGDSPGLVNTECSINVKPLKSISFEAPTVCLIQSASTAMFQTKSTFADIVSHPETLAPIYKQGFCPFQNLRDVKYWYNRSQPDSKVVARRTIYTIYMRNKRQVCESITTNTHKDVGWLTSNVLASASDKAQLVT